MKKTLIVIMVLISNLLLGQSVYTFSGDGNWTDPKNWDGGLVPPNNLISGQEIIINPTGVCNLNILLTLTNGAKLTVNPGKQFTLIGDKKISTTGLIYSSYNSVTTGGIIINDAGSSVVSRGVCWDTTSNPTVTKNVGKTSDGSGSGAFTSLITKLGSDTLYYVRAYFINTTDTFYGNELTVRMPPVVAPNYFTDQRDGQIYYFKQIGTQVWMTSNLNYNTPDSWCNDDNLDNCGTYGRLYNFSSALTAAPLGWHIPTSNEWKTLLDYLEGSSIAGGKMKDNIYWDAPNTGATNSSGFNAIGGGYRGPDGASGYGRPTRRAFWWGIDYQSIASHMYLSYNSEEAILTTPEEIDQPHEKTYGYSIRCIKD
jgi:uncharacterized protein (TIGR02145 family)